MPKLFRRQYVPASNSTSDMDSAPPLQTSSHIPKLSSAYNRRILFACVLVLAPMVAFSVTLVWIVFSKLVETDYCPHPEICYAPNKLVNGAHYYVDFPIGRLVFVSSLSSTVSFTLVAALMTTYGVVVARDLLQTSQEKIKHAELPSPYQISLLVRLINAELFLFWSMRSSIFRRRNRTSQGAYTRQSSVVRKCLTVFVLALLSSIFIQVADTYLHIATKEISITTLVSDTNRDRDYSRQLGSWCLDPEDTYGTLDNRNFWSCAFRATFPGEQPGLADPVSWDDAVATIDSHVAYYRDENGTNFSIMRPSGISPDIDWAGTTYGVSTQCAPIPPTSCNIGRLLDDDPVNVHIWGYFQCNYTHPGNSSESRSIVGNITGAYSSVWFEDWHAYMEESPPFTNDPSFAALIEDGGLRIKANDSIINGTTLEQSNENFRNPWNWLVEINGQSFSNNSIIWELTDGVRSPTYYFVLACESTVWDVRVAFAENKVFDMTATKSNGTVTGIVSMSALGSGGLLRKAYDDARMEANQDRSSIEAYVSGYERAISKTFTIPLVHNTVPASAELAQRRVTKIIARLPVAALWLLLIANLGFALLALVLTILASGAASPEVHQVHTRLTAAGLAAQLLDRQYSRKPVMDEKDLFREFREHAESVDGDAIKPLVRVRTTLSGGAEFVSDNSFTSREVLSEKGPRPIHRRTLSV